jgi:hypothetical protein
MGVNQNASTCVDVLVSYYTHMLNLQEGQIIVLLQLHGKLNTISKCCLGISPSPSSQHTKINVIYHVFYTALVLLGQKIKAISSKKCIY